MLSNILVELPWATLGAVVLFFCWYYPIGLYRNAEYTNSVASRGGLEFLFVWEFLMFSSTFAHFMIAGIATAEAASNLANVLFSLCLLFNGVLVGPNAMPGFWIFMYRVSPFTYLVEGLLGNGVAHAPVHCADNEFLQFTAPSLDLWRVSSALHPSRWWIFGQPGRHAVPVLLVGQHRHFLVNGEHFIRK